MAEREMQESGEDNSGPQIDHVYWDAEKKPWKCEGFWTHPKHRDYHVHWTGEYAILQEYGNYKNRIQLVEIKGFSERFTLAWNPMTLCKFCGFMRMSPCKRLQTCPSLRDYKLEPDDVDYEEAQS